MNDITEETVIGNQGKNILEITQVCIDEKKGLYKIIKSIKIDEVK